MREKGPAIEEAEEVPYALRREAPMTQGEPGKKGDIRSGGLKMGTRPPSGHRSAAPERRLLRPAHRPPIGRLFGRARRRDPLHDARSKHVCPMNDCREALGTLFRRCIDIQMSPFGSLPTGTFLGKRFSSPSLCFRLIAFPYAAYLRTPLSKELTFLLHVLCYNDNIGTHGFRQEKGR